MTRLGSDAIRGKGLALAAALTLVTVPALAAGPLSTCTVVDRLLAPGAVPSRLIQVGLTNGQVDRIAATGEAGNVYTIVFTPLRPGVSYRHAIEPQATTPPRHISIFNLATVEAAGTILTETWMLTSAAPAPPALSWTRLHCPPA